VSSIAAIGTAMATGLAIVGLVLVVLLTPPYIHLALGSADSAAWLGVSPEGAQTLSDRTVGELVFGPGSFAFPIADGRPAFYDAAEASHLRDARSVLYGFGVAVIVAVLVLGVGFVRRRREVRFWRAIAGGAGGLAAVFAVIGAVFLVAFDAAFTLFHEIFFPGGNWSFDPATEHLVQLYPIPFWQLTTTVLGGLVIAVAAFVWWVARRRAATLAGATLAGATLAGATAG
jgi:integral membrane protein (TIGR01906 family)